MSKNLALVLGIAVIAAVSAPTYAGLSTNGLSTNGLSTNGLSTNGLSTNGLNLQAIRVVMPDGAELSFR